MCRQSEVSFGITDLTWLFIPSSQQGEAGLEEELVVRKAVMNLKVFFDIIDLIWL